MKDRRGFLKQLGIGVGAGAFALGTLQLTDGKAKAAPAVEKFPVTWDLLDRNMLYEFHTISHGVGQGISLTANPRDKYRPYLVDMYASGESRYDLLNAMIDKSLELAFTEDTRGWSVAKWNDNLRSAHEIAAAKQYEKGLMKFNQRSINHGRKS